jgi:hypothetical protein
VTRWAQGREVREMRDADTILTIIRERGGRGLPLEGVYRQLYNPALYTIVALVLPPLCITMGVYSTGDSSPVFSVVPRGIDGLSPRCSGLPFPALEGLADAIPHATASGTSTI